MYKILSFYNIRLSDKTYTILLLLFLVLLGSHFLDYNLYILLAFAAFLIHWNTLFNKNILLIMSFILSIYITWVSLDQRLLYQFNLALGVFSHGILIFFMYLLGFGIKIEYKNKRFITNKNIFYLLFTFVISYSFFVLWSYLTIEQDHPLRDLGMYVCFPNPYKNAHVNGGHLISTILSYYLTLMSFILPLLLFYFRKLKQQGFYYIDLCLVVCLSIFVFYISAAMGRRTVFVLFVLVFFFFFFTSFMQYSKRSKKNLLLILVASTLFYGAYSLLSASQEKSMQTQGIIITSDFIIPIMSHKASHLSVELATIPIIRRLSHKGLSDHRFSWWSDALNIMLEYPFGGGNGIYIAPGKRLAHNTWIDMGKDLGIIPFTLFLFITLLHLYYLFYIFFSRRVESLLKYQLMVISMGIFPIMMIEPIFNSDKTFFAYIFFYFGILSKFYIDLKKKDEYIKSMTAL